jgi:hypothetical protein
MISNMPNLDRVYSSLLGLADLSKCYVNVPNIHDPNGVLITLTEYEDKLKNGMTMMVNVYMKQCVAYRRKLTH